MTILKAFDTVRERWGDKVVEEVLKTKRTMMSFNEFLTYFCIASGGDFGKLLLSGVKELYPAVWDAIPDKMGKDCFSTICYLLWCLGVDMSEDV